MISNAKSSVYNASAVDSLIRECMKRKNLNLSKWDREYRALH